MTDPQNISALSNGITAVLVIYLLISVGLLIHAWNKKEFPAPFKNELVNRFFWIIAILCLNPLITGFYLMTLWRAKKLPKAIRYLPPVFLILQVFSLSILRPIQEDFKNEIFLTAKPALNSQEFLKIDLTTYSEKTNSSRSTSSSVPESSYSIMDCIAVTSEDDSVLSQAIARQVAIQLSQGGVKKVYFRTDSTLPEKERIDGILSVSEDVEINSFLTTGFSAKGTIRVKFTTTLPTHIGICRMSSNDEIDYAGRMEGFNFGLSYPNIIAQKMAPKISQPFLKFRFDDIEKSSAQEELPNELFPAFNHSDFNFELSHLPGKNIVTTAFCGFLSPYIQKISSSEILYDKKMLDADTGYHPLKETIDALGKRGFKSQFSSRSYPATWSGELTHDELGTINYTLSPTHWQESQPLKLKADIYLHKTLTHIEINALATQLLATKKITAKSLLPFLKIMTKENQNKILTELNAADFKSGKKLLNIINSCRSNDNKELHRLLSQIRLLNALYPSQKATLKGIEKTAERIHYQGPDLKSELTRKEWLAFGVTEIVDTQKGASARIKMNETHFFITPENKIMSLGIKPGISNDGRKQIHFAIYLQSGSTVTSHINDNELTQPISSGINSWIKSLYPPDTNGLYKVHLEKMSAR